MKDLRTGSKLSLWLVAAPVAAWGVHFLAVYVIAAIYCAKAGTAAAGSMTAVRWLVVAVTLAALAVYTIAAVRGHAGLRGTSADSEAEIHDQDRFLGRIAVMVCSLSAAATLFLASVPFFFGDCRP